jgi:hypothetical protein
MANQKVKSKSVVGEKLSPNEICDAYAEEKVGLEIRVLRDNKDDPNQLVLIQGTKNALEMLSRLIFAIAQDEKSDKSSFSISPRGAGSMHFNKSSEFGVYINRLPSKTSKK